MYFGWPGYVEHTDEELFEDADVLGVEVPDVA